MTASTRTSSGETRRTPDDIRHVTRKRIATALRDRPSLGRALSSGPPLSPSVTPSPQNNRFAPSSTRNPTRKQTQAQGHRRLPPVGHRTTGSTPTNPKTADDPPPAVPSASLPPKDSKPRVPSASPLSRSNHPAYCRSAHTARPYPQCASSAQRVSPPHHYPPSAVHHPVHPHGGANHSIHHCTPLPSPQLRRGGRGAPRVCWPRLPYPTLYCAHLRGSIDLPRPRQSEALECRPRFDIGFMRGKGGASYQREPVRAVATRNKCRGRRRERH